MTVKCDLCGMHFENVEARESHMQRDHQQGLSKWSDSE